jgi:hypothetical protein
MPGGRMMLSARGPPLRAARAQPGPAPPPACGPAHGNPAAAARAVNLPAPLTPRLHPPRERRTAQRSPPRPPPPPPIRCGRLQEGLSDLCDGRQEHRPGAPRLPRPAPAGSRALAASPAARRACGRRPTHPGRPPNACPTPPPTPSGRPGQDLHRGQLCQVRGRQPQLRRHQHVRPAPPQPGARPACASLPRAPYTPDPPAAPLAAPQGVRAPAQGAAAAAPRGARAPRPLQAQDLGALPAAGCVAPRGACRSALGPVARSRCHPPPRPPPLLNVPSLFRLAVTTTFPSADAFAAYGVSAPGGNAPARAGAAGACSNGLPC